MRLIKKVIAKQRKFHYKEIYFLDIVQKMRNGILNFKIIKATKSAYHNSKYPTDINQIDIKKILMCDKI